MTNFSRLLFYFAVIVLVIGCSGMVPMYEVDKSHTIHTIGRSLTKLDISEGILQGAQAAGWYAKILPSGRIRATFLMRVHAVHVEIFYTNAYYKLTYKSSDGMKMFCTEQDRLEARNLKISGRQNCPGNGAPMYIHGNYKKWVDSLNMSIHNSLASM
jgi:hypothetical protein